MLLTNDLEGDVWLFTPDEQALVVSKLDDQGEAVESKTIEPPRGWKVDVASNTLLSSYRQSWKGPAVQVTWPVTVESEALNPRAMFEWIKFGESLDDPERIVADESSPLYGLDLAWGADDSLYGLSGITIQKFNRKRERVWKQSALQMSIDRESATWFALLDDDRVALFSSGPQSFFLNIIDADGNFEPKFSQPMLRPLTPLVPQQGPHGPVIVTPNIQSDLVVASLQTKPFALKGALLLQEEYLRPTITPNAVDPAGNIYVALTVGGRERRDQRRLICRVLVSAEAECRALPNVAELEITEENIHRLEIAVNAEGVVFMRSD